MGNFYRIYNRKNVHLPKIQRTLRNLMQILNCRKRIEEMTRHFKNEEIETGFRHISFMENKKNVIQTSYVAFHVHHTNKKIQKLLNTVLLFSFFPYLSRNLFLSEYKVNSCEKAAISTDRKVALYGSTLLPRLCGAGDTFTHAMGDRKRRSTFEGNSVVFAKAVEASIL